MAGDYDKAQLIADLAIARSRISDAGQALQASAAEMKQKLDVGARVKSSYGKHPGLWNAGAAILGFLLARIPARKKVVYVERSTGETLGSAGKGGNGFLWGAVKMAAGLAKPLVSMLASQKLGDLAQRFAAGKAAPPEPDEEDME